MRERRSSLDNGEIPRPPALLRGGRRIVAVIALALLAGSACPSVAWADDADAPSSFDVAAAAFAPRDKNGDGLLSLQEYTAAVKGAGPIKRAARDFKVFDGDNNKSLSLREFAAIPGVVPEEHRGPLPDPFEHFVQAAVDAMDQSFQNWNQQPTRTVEYNTFVQSFINTLGNRSTSISQTEVDPNRDGQVTREEAVRFIEIQLGARGPDGVPLRLSNGHTVYLAKFERIDADNDGRLTLQEMSEHGSFGERTQAVFATGDTNNDSRIDFNEWRRMPGYGTIDHVGAFLDADKDLDGALNRDELIAGALASRRQVAANALPAFDFDNDGQLSLDEYRVTMVANRIVPWQQTLKDPNGDGLLAFDEFQFGDRKFPLLRWTYFNILDTNHDDKLDPQEFYFKQKQPLTFYIINEDGTDWREFFQFEGYPRIGSPAVSPDGKQIAFDASSITPRRPTTIFTMGFQQHEPKKLDVGMMPTWSRDGRRLACSQNGVRIISLDGKTDKLIRQGGWGAQWSPDGKQVAFTELSFIKVYDVDTEEIRNVINFRTHGYRHVYWNMAWSPDSRRLCFKGKKADNSSELAIVDVTAENPKPQVRVSTKAALETDFAWHPGGKRLVFSMHSGERGTNQLFELNPDTDEKPRLFPGQDPTSKNLCGCWTPDGRRLIAISGDY